MANMRKTSRRAVMVLPELEDIARLKRYALERGMLNQRGEPNVAGAINEITSLELRRQYKELTAEEYLWCAEQQRINEESRAAKKGK
jgi:hypothetical protein